MTLFRHVKTKYGAVPVYDITNTWDQTPNLHTLNYNRITTLRHVMTPTGRYRSDQTPIHNTEKHHIKVRPVTSTQLQYPNPKENNRIRT